MLNEKEETVVEKEVEEKEVQDATNQAASSQDSGSDSANNETEHQEEVELQEDDEITKLKEQLEEEENRRLRLLADYENFKRRANLDKEAMQKYRSQHVMTNILPVLDNFARALQVEPKTEEAQSIMKGMDMIYRTLIQALEDEGLTEIEALDKEFDPNFHQAVMTGADESKPSGSVIEVMQKGYMLKDRVLRPSMVKVNE